MSLSKFHLRNKTRTISRTYNIHTYTYVEACACHVFVRDTHCTSSTSLIRGCRCSEDRKGPGDQGRGTSKRDWSCKPAKQQSQFSLPLLLLLLVLALFLILGSLQTCLDRGLGDIGSAQDEPCSEDPRKASRVCTVKKFIEDIWFGRRLKFFCEDKNVGPTSRPKGEEGRRKHCNRALQLDKLHDTSYDNHLA